MNSVILIGRLTKEPELTYTPNTQTAKTTFTLAVDRPRRNGEDQGADFIRVVVWGKQAETCDRYLGKGKQVAVLGNITTGSYTNRDGVKVYTTDVTANRVEFLGGGGEYGEKPKEADRGNSGHLGASQVDGIGSYGDIGSFDDFNSLSDDIPF